MNTKFWLIALIATIIFIFTLLAQGGSNFSGGVLGQILTIAGCIFIIWLLYKTIKTNPQLFARDSLSKAFGTMGWLALALIAVIAFVILSLRI